jgi:hypothetical protein
MYGVAIALNRRGADRFRPNNANGSLVRWPRPAAGFFSYLPNGEVLMFKILEQIGGNWIE